MASTDRDGVFSSHGETEEEFERAKDILHHHYGMKLTSCRSLGGFDDVNYLVTVDGDHPDRDQGFWGPSSGQYVLRIINAKDSQQPERLEAINEAMKHVHRKGIITQIPVVNLQGEEISFCTVLTQATSTEHAVVLRTFLPGTCLESRALSPHDVFNCGVFASLVTRAFEDFHHPFFDNFHFTWGVDNRKSFQTLMLPSVKDVKERSLIEEITDAVNKKLSNMDHRLKRAQVHADIGTPNIIVPNDYNSDSTESSDEDSARQQELTVTQWRLVDFHDTHRSYRIFDLVSCAARIMSSYQPVLFDKLDAPGHVLAGYQTTMDLDSSELDVFPYLVLVYLCTEQLGRHYYLGLNPDNAEYLQRNIHTGIQALKSLWDLTPGQAQVRWEQIARSYVKREGHALNPPQH